MLPLHPLTAAGALLIGGAMGLAGVGGFFLIPLLAALEGLTIQQAAGTSLVTFVCTGLVGAILYAVHGHVRWRMALLTSAGSLVSGPLGAATSVSLPQWAVQLVFALFLLYVGARALAPGAVQSGCPTVDRPHSELGTGALLGCGVIVGFGAGLIGVGGPAILVPLLVLAGIPVPLAVGVSQVNQVIASASGAAEHLLFGQVDLRLAAILTVFEVVGVWVGARLSRRMGPARVKTIVGVLCVGVALWTLGSLVA